MFTTFGQMWLQKHDPVARKVLLQTADSLATRFSPIIGCTRSWNSPKSEPNTFLVIADNLMNLELLWWAGQESGNVTYTEIATSHADKMIQDLFQPFNPGCAWHLITYDQNTGALLNRSSTPQGLGLDTVWARGQAWSVYGFTMAFRYSRQPRYLQQAQAAAQCFIRLVTDCCGNDVYNWAPFWDFNVTGAAISVDTSAMAIVASALAELDGYVAGAGYGDFARKLVNAAGDSYLFGAGENDAVLKNGTVTYPLAGVSIVYGDYYLLEAVRKLNAAAR